MTTTSRVPLEYTDDGIERCFATIDGIAAALEAATVVNSSTHHKSKAGAATTSESALPSAVRGGCGTSGAARTDTTAPTTTSTSAAAAVADATGPTDGVPFSLPPPPLLLPKGSGGAELAETLNKVGETLSHTVGELRHRVDAQLVDFLRYTQRNGQEEVREMRTKRSIVPSGFTALTAVLDVDREVGLGDGGNATLGTSGAGSYLGTGWSVATHSEHADRVARTSSTTLPVLRPVKADGTRGGGGGGAGAEAGAGRSTTEGGEAGLFHATATSNSNAPASRQWQERRAAAGSLQSFLYLLLESALTQTSTTCGAVYLNSMEEDAPGSSKGRKAATPRYLLRVAHINGEAKLPGEVSYATLSTLTAVVQNGVAVNLRNAAYHGVAHLAGAKPCDDAGPAASAPPTHRRHLIISSGVIVPIRDFGCVVLADKKGGGSGSFSVLDEHVGWSVANTAEAVLTRYNRSLLLEFQWSPLRPLASLVKQAQLPSVDQRLVKMRSSKGRTESFLTGGDDDDVFGEKGGLLTEAGCMPSGTGTSPLDPFERGFTPKVLTIVRTSEERTIKAVPIGLRLRKGQANSSTDGDDDGNTHDTLDEEELFQGAAEYIANLESLWRQSLTENNTLQAVIATNERAVQASKERISALEEKVRSLNGRVVLLERQLAKRVS